MIEVIQPTPLRLTEEDLERYVWDRGRGLTRLVGLSFRKGSTGYTYFAPRDIRMREGQWAPVSPSFFWGLNDDEVKRSVLSAALYYIWPEEVPAYTELWLGDMSSHFPYNLQIILKTELRDVEVWVDEKLKLVNCYFPKDIFKKLQGFHKACIRTLSNNGALTKLLIDNIDFKRDEECIQFNFRKVGEILQPLEKGYELNNLIRNIYGRYEIERVVKALESKLQESKLQASPNSSKLKDLAAILIKLLLIGPECGTALRIIGPKQFKFIESDGRCRYLGVFGALVRVYGDCEPDLEERLRELYPAAYLLTSNVGFRVTSHFLLEFLRAESIRTAVAAIMGRNMSHNIGSHAVWHIAQSGLEGYGKEEVERFLLYLQKRMDFIAQVSTSPPSWCMTMKWNGTDESSLMMGFTEQKCLLDNIAWSYKVRYCDFWFRDPNIQNDEKPEIRLKIQQCSPPEDIAVDIPHGQIGAQAFYTILENLIRNTAKYGDRTRAAENAYLPLEFTVKIEEEWDDLGKGWKKNYYRVLIRDNWETSQETVEKLNDALAEPIVDPETGELKPGNWGMKEIKICAGYLRMLRPEEIDDKYQEWKGGSSSEPPLIEAKLTNSEWEEVRNSGHLTYILYLLCPKKALLVGKFSNIEVENRTKPKNTGGGYDDGNR
jgi:hypothetical protein